MTQTIQTLRAVLQPLGTADIVELQMFNRFFHKKFVDECIDELEKLPTRAALGEPPTALERLAYALLCDSAYIPN